MTVESFQLLCNVAVRFRPCRCAACTIAVHTDLRRERTWQDNARGSSAFAEHGRVRIDRVCSTTLLSPPTSALASISIQARSRVETSPTVTQPPDNRNSGVRRAARGVQLGRLFDFRRAIGRSTGCRDLGGSVRGIDLDPRHRNFQDYRWARGTALTSVCAKSSPSKRSGSPSTLASAYEKQSPKFKPAG